MQECNPPRNSWLQTHQDDGPQGGARDGFALGVKRTAELLTFVAFFLTICGDDLARFCVQASDSKRHLIPMGEVQREQMAAFRSITLEASHLLLNAVVAPGFANFVYRHK